MRVYTQALLACGLLAAASPASASYILTFTEQGSNVVASGKGSVNTADLSPIANVNVQPFINPAFATFALGYGAASYFYGATGTDPFGTGGPSTPDTSSGGPIGYASLYGSVILPQGYNSGADLDVAATWANATFQSLGLTEGKYTYTWGTGANADSLTVDVGGISTVPLPAAAPLFGAALLAFGVAGYGMRRRGAATA